MENIYLSRRKKLSSNMRNGDMCIIFSGKEVRISRDEYYDFNVDKNFYYLTGVKDKGIILFLRKINGDVKSTLFIEDRAEDMVKWIGKTILKDEAISISGVDEVLYIDEFYSFLNNIILSEESPTVYFDFDRDDHRHSYIYSEECANKLRVKYPHVNIKNIYSHIKNLRVIKDDYEISKIREAIDITKLGILNIMRNLKPNMYEYQIESYFDYMIKYSGASGYAFKSIVASGDNAVILHYIENNSKIKDGDLVLFDLGAEKDFYRADISRTFPSNGKFTDRQKEIYSIVLEAQLRVIDAICPGVSQSDLNEIAKEHLYLGLKRIGKISNRDELSNYYYHGIGHLLGLDTHDVGGRDFVYKEGMVVTVEPGLYLKDEGIGIRIEDDILVTKDGHEVLSEGIIKTVDEIEKFMGENCN
ncbi:aminopeptidase P family protein [Candidatus Arthromitus sp. SFB-rat-Yit]|uniref:aminopeptidase P family protein n=1 Tax=Candidatus Arthromitus sp. SFB-rat-Yit TaxID=1041504 RepID=UPI000227A1DA|nr:aminopeptidase P family protein [Candidatus Arthromitus sp. SFB-rat-Yit]BAK80751.1 Xaa-pro aminopeptidase [Candidatus Arthromitus sp. SFB-rat-Yit]